GVHPFNQPNVEAAKQLAKRMVDESRATGKPPLLKTNPLSQHAISKFLASVKPEDYVSLHAYLPQTKDLTETLQSLRMVIRDRYGIAATLGYGPRFLHSTGQLHKGDRGNGYFIQFVSETMSDVPIPDSAEGTESSLSFGALIASQAFGDRQALENGQRPVLTLAVSELASESIRAVASCLRGT
ncbi:phosphoheptose isomerase, partial [Candidatus Bipolaricaulota bacterium]|nr:phosphoheptose isomerase [Candidatus Bipolaricaulota bacterium]